MRPLFRRALFWLHFITGLAAGAVILSMAVSGLLISYETQVMDWAGRGLRSTPQATGMQRLGIEELLHRVREARPGFVPGGITWKSDPAAPVTLTAGRDEVCYASPYTGRLHPGGDPAGWWRDFFHAVTDWHRFLAQAGLQRPAGRALTGAGTLLFGVLLVSGLCLWWPRHWRPSSLRAALLLNPAFRGRARDWNWHNVAGFWSALPLLLIMLTGLMMSYGWANHLLFRLAGDEPPPARGSLPGMPAGARGEGPGGREHAGARGQDGAEGSRPRLPVSLEGLDELLAEVRSRHPGWVGMSLRMPQSPGGPLPLMIDCGGRGQPHLRTLLNLDPAARKILPNNDDFSRLSQGRRLRMLARWLHTGELFGVVGQTIAALATLCAVVLVWTGFALAWRRIFGGRASG